eukprot:scaffold3806_cov169-Amphora_coffeaeformis.AAC.3
MRLALVLQLALGVRFCHAWVAPNSKRSVSMVASHGTMASSRITTTTPTSLFQKQSNDEPQTTENLLASQFKTADYSSRIRKFASPGRFGIGTNKRGISVLLAVIALISLVPSAAHAALSSTMLSATAVTSMTMRKTTQIGGGLQAWQCLLAALVWVWQSAAPNLLPLISQGLHASMAWYMMQLSVNPLVTKGITAGVIGSLGDFLAQSLENFLHQRKNNAPVVHSKYDPRRGLSTLLYGFFISGPLMHFAYDLFDRVLPIHGNGAALVHVLADSIFLDAIFVAATYIVTGRMEGYKFRQVMPQLRKDYLPTLKASWATSIFLMPVEFVCFRFLPLNYRVLAVNFIDLIWDGVISFMAHRSRQDNKHVVLEAPAVGVSMVQEEGAALQAVLQ